jgi:hypothetical protein
LLLAVQDDIQEFGLWKLDIASIEPSFEDSELLICSSLIFGSKISSKIVKIWVNLPNQVLVLLCDFLIVNWSVGEVLDEQMLAKWSISWLQIFLIVDFIYLFFEFYMVEVNDGSIASA